MFIPADSKATTSKEDIEIARQTLSNCQKSRVQGIDDKQSDARVITLNLTNLCLVEYETLNRMTAQENFDTTNERRMFTIEQNLIMLKIEASLNVVKVNRQEKP